MGPKFVCKTLDIVQITLRAKYEAMGPKFVCKTLYIVWITLGAKYEAKVPNLSATYTLGL